MESNFSFRFKTNYMEADDGTVYVCKSEQDKENYLLYPEYALEQEMIIGTVVSSQFVISALVNKEWIVQNG